MKRILLILDGTEAVDAALSEVKHLCDPNDKLTVLAVAVTPSREVLQFEPANAPVEDFPGGPPWAGPGMNVPIMEKEGDAESRLAQELREVLDEHVARAKNGIRIWTQAIVRDRPAEAVADYVRSSDFAEMTVPRHSLPRLHELLTDPAGQDALDGSLAPVIVLPA